jgi:membrane protein involved in colicin uptake
LADQRKAEDAKRDAEARKAAEDAKKKAVSIRSNPSVNTNATTAGTVRDELVRAFSSASF